MRTTQYTHLKFVTSVNSKLAQFNLRNFSNALLCTRPRRFLDSDSTGGTPKKILRRLLTGTAGQSPAVNHAVGNTEQNSGAFVRY